MLTIPLPEPSNAGGRPPSKAKKAGNKTPRKATHKAKKASPRPEPTPTEVEARAENRRAYEQERNQTPERKELLRRVTQSRREEAKRLGLCVGCGETPIPGETRCESCAENHRQYRRQAEHRATLQKDQASGQGTMF